MDDLELCNEECEDAWAGPPPPPVPAEQSFDLSATASRRRSYIATGGGDSEDELIGLGVVNPGDAVDQRVLQHMLRASAAFDASVSDSVGMHERLKRELEKQEKEAVAEKAIEAAKEKEKAKVEADAKKKQASKGSLDAFYTVANTPDEKRYAYIATYFNVL